MNKIIDEIITDDGETILVIETENGNTFNYNLNKKDLFLEELCNDYNEFCNEQELDWGEPVGNEIW